MISLSTFPPHHVTIATFDSFSKSLEISHEEDRDKRESKLLIVCLVESVDEEPSCDSLFKFKIDPVVTIPPSGWDFLLSAKLLN